jgi:DNA-binding beta-propeller fold protein YncE
MSIDLGTPQYGYRVVENWAKLPEGLVVGDVSDIGIDGHDRVYLFNRGEHPVIVLEQDGTYARCWGEGLFRRPHGLRVGPDGSLYCTDDAGHTVRKFTPEGKLLLQLGEPDKPSGYMEGKPFNRCTNTALSSNGEIYVSDGYGNARVHKFSPDGKLLLSWGEPGTRAGQFNVVHSICVDVDGWVYVADRENHRVQVFDRNGRFETQWNNLHRPCGMYMRGERGALCYIAEAGTGLAINRQMPNIGPRVCVLTLEGKQLAQLGFRSPGQGLDQFVSVHGIAADSQGDIYVGETANHSWPSLFPGQPVPTGLRTFRKLAKVAI